MKLNIFAFLILFYSSLANAQKPVRVIDTFDFDWKFALHDDPKYAEPEFSDKDWANVQLAHDWNIKQGF